MNKTKHFQQWMKALACWLMLWLVLAGVNSCQMREVLGPDDEGHISIDVDWSLMDETPTGMTVIFYPTDGSMPYKYVTNDVFHIEQSLPEKDYDILIFNQTIEEFNTIQFRGMDKLETAEAYAPESTDTGSRLDRLYNSNRNRGSRGYNTNAHMRPKSLGSATTTTQNNTRPTRGYNTNAHMRPKPKIGQLTATVHVAGLSNAIGVNGAITGMASGTFLTDNGALSHEALTQELADWDIQLNADGSIGSIYTSIGTFGLSPTVGHSSTSRAEGSTKADFEATYVESSDEDDYRNILYLNFLLKDRTYVSYRFDVTSAIQDYTADVEVELVLDLGTNLEEYLELPETGLPYDQPFVTVDSWGEEVDHYITFD